MMNVTELALQRRSFFYFLLVCMVVGGIIAYDSISKLEDPELVVMQSQIVTFFPGATAHEVEMQVTNIIEDELGTLANIESIRSRSMANISVITVMLDLTVPQAEIEQRWDFLRRRIAEVEYKLPDGAMSPVVYDDFGDVYGMFYAMTAEGVSYSEMSRMARHIKTEMLTVPGVARVEIFGEQKATTEIVLPLSKMGEMAVSPYQIIASLRGQTSTVFPGVYDLGDTRLNVSIGGSIESSQDVADLLVRGFDGSLVRLSDIANVRDSYSYPTRNILRVNNKPAIAISISMESGENIIRVGERVENRMAQLQDNIPAGYEFHKVFFQPDVVRDAIDGFVTSIAASVIIVIMVLMIMMGWRSGIIIGVGLLLTILATFPVLLAAGGTLQRISLGAFIVAMGMLVDNAIVVIDGILIDHKKGIKRPLSLVGPALRTAWPLFGATFIAVAAFLPVFLSQDAAGTYARDLFIVLCISLFISWVLALTQVPLFSEKLLKNIPLAVNENQLFEGWGYKKIKQVLIKLLRYKTASVIVAALLLILAVINFGNIRNIFFPDFKYSQLFVEYRLPSGSSPQRVNTDLYSITEHLLTKDEVELVVSSHGQTPARYSLVRPMGEGGDNYGELIINFKDFESMIRMKPPITEYIRANYPDARFRLRKYNLSIKSSHTVEVEFSGPDPAVLRNLAEQAKAVFRQNPYMDAYTLENDWEPMGKALTVNYSPISGQLAGVTRQDVSNAIMAVTDGLPIGGFFEGETEVDIVLKLRNYDGTKIDNLEHIPVWRMLPNISHLNEQNIRELLTGVTTIDDLSGLIFDPIPLSTVVDNINFYWQEQVVRRVNGRRAIQVQCEPLDGYSPAQVRQASLDKMAEIQLPPGYTMTWVGEYELQSAALTNIFSYLPISIFLIIVTLILLFKDFRKPIIVLICIPMAFIGIVPGMILAGQPFTFMAIIGSFGLMGMIVKNAIVLLDEVETLIATGIEKHNAIINATIARTRPVLLASVTTILGMVPLVKDPMYASMAVAIISGLLAGTVITLLLVPILYATFYKVKINK